jgi:acyl carrier protein
METDILRIINTVLDNRGKKHAVNVNKDYNLRNDIGFDSLDLAELTVRIEAEFGIDIFEDGIVVTVGDIMKKLTNE